MMNIKEKEKKAYDAMKEAFGYTNVMQAPRVTKVIVSTGVGKTRNDKNKMTVVEDRLEKITGQKPAMVLAKKSIAQFKIRAGETAGYKVTLSGDRAHQFLDKLVNIAIPRTKDFRGINRTSVDEMGNLTWGVKENVIFPETGDEDLRDVFGMAITIVTTASNKEQATAFFEHLGVPFKKLVVSE